MTPFLRLTDSLRKGESLNLPAILERYGHMTLHQHVVDWFALGMHMHIELRSVLLTIYAVLLGCCSWGIARQARLGDRRLLLSIAAPWAMMFFVLGQMDERYLVWAACFSAGALAVNRKALGAHAMLSLAGAATMLEFLLICKPEVWPLALPVLIAMNPVIWLMTAAAVAIVFFGSLRSVKRSKTAEVQMAHAMPSPDQFGLEAPSTMGISWGPGRNTGQSSTSQRIRRIPPSPEQSAA